MKSHQAKPRAKRASDPGEVSSASVRKDSPDATADQITKDNVEKVLKLEESMRAKAGMGEKLADAITRFCGSMLFVWIHLIWFGVWITGNLALPKELRFDPLPFSFLTLMVSLEAIFLSTFILISQNRQSILDQRRSHLDLQIDLLSEQENTKMLELLEKIACKVGVELGDDNTIKALAEAVKPEHLAQQIDSSMEHHVRKGGGGVGAQESKQD